MRVIALLGLSLVALAPARAVPPVELSRSATSLPTTQPRTPSALATHRAQEQPSIRIVEPAEGAQRSVRDFRVKVAVSHVDNLDRLVNVSILYEQSCYFSICSSSRLDWQMPLRALVAGWAPERLQCKGCTPVEFPLYPIPTPQTVVLQVADPSLAQSDAATLGNAGLASAITFRLVDNEINPGLLRQRGAGRAVGTPPPPSAARASDGTWVRGTSTTAASSTAPSAPSSASIVAAGASGATLKIVEPAPDSTSAPDATRLRITYGVQTQGQLADIELSWQDYASRTGPMNAALATNQGTKTWQVPLGVLAQGLVIPRDKTCDCTNGHATVKVRPAGATRWYDSVQFTIARNAAGSTTAASRNPWSAGAPTATTPANANALRVTPPPSAGASMSRVPVSALRSQ